MCGIVGVFSPDGLSIHDIERATKIMSHRGPDDEGYMLYNGEVVEEFVGDDSVVRGLPHIKEVRRRKKFVFSMAHRRLSILDITEKGHQPMSDEERKVWIVHNGEIYNFREIRDELVKRGYTFRSCTDTEVILKAYKEWGTDCVRRFNGMWAFAILDIEKDLLFLSRDRLGVKPLYYYVCDSFFAFASEIKSLLLIQKVPIKPNHEIIWDYLVMSLINHTDETFFRGIKQVPPSHNAIIEIGRRNQGKINLRFEKYYKPKVSDDIHKKESIIIDEIARELREILYSAVERHLISDVPVGSCLSGGIDSSTIVCVLNDILRKKEIPQVGDVQKTFTFSSVKRELDESDYAREVVRRCKVSSHFTSPDADDFVKDIEKVVFHQEEPFGSTSIYGQYKVMEIAKDAGVKVLLDGQGADELFAGYKTYFPVFITQLIVSGKLGEMLKNVFAKFALNKNDLLYSIPFILLFIPIVLERKLKELIDAYYPHREKEKLVISRIIYIQRKLSTMKFIKAINDNFFSEYTERFFEWFSDFFRWVGNLNRSLEDSVFRFSLPELLRYEDRNSMAFSIESRPLFSDDVEIINFAFSIPASAKIKDGWTKYILRRSMEGVLPEKVLWRKDKFAFFTPEREWIGKNKSFFKTYLLDVKDDYVNGDFIWRNFDEVLNFSGGIFKRGSFMWRLLNFKIWWKIFMQDIRRNKKAE